MHGFDMEKLTRRNVETNLFMLQLQSNLPI